MSDVKLYTHVDPFTGEEFKSPVANHYEAVDSVPKAPPVDMPRLTLRERIERMLHGGYDPSSAVYDDDDPDDWSDGDDDPLTPAEQALVTSEQARERLLAAADEAKKQAATPPRPAKASQPPKPPNPPSDGQVAPEDDGEPDGQPFS